MPAERERTSAPLWIALLTVLGVFLPFQAFGPGMKNQEGGTAKPVNHPEEHTTRSSGSQRWQDHLAEFLGEPFSPSPKPRHPLLAFFYAAQVSATTEHSEVSAKLKYALDKYIHSFLIATLPDPVDSRFGYMFDMRVDAIQRAVESRGFVMDRFWFPWEESLSHDPTKDGRPRLHEREPGLILFRRRKPNPDAQTQIRTEGVFFLSQAASECLSTPFHRLTQVPVVAEIDTRVHNDELLIVFLVGELPNAGVHKRALRTSLDGVLDYSLTPDDTPFRIMGPTFSGSQPSFEVSLRTWHSGHSEYHSKHPVAEHHFLVFSGAANAVNGDEFEDNLKDLGVTYRSAVHEDKDLFENVLTFIQRHQAHDEERIAVLCESNTQYGKSIADQLKQKPRHILTLPFPLHIAELRTAFDHGNAEKPNSATQLPSLSSAIRIPFDDNPSTRDVEPSLSPAMTPVAAELVLANILTTIAREEIRFVGLAATDTRDKVFLASLIRKYCPDVQLFTTQSDLLLTHPEYTQVLRGTIVGSSYPLFPRNQRWTYPFRGHEKRLLFSQQGEEGCYNATLALLAAKPSVPIDRGDVPEAHGQPERDTLVAFDQETLFLDFGMPFQGRDKQERIIGPKIWISMVGRRALYPLEVIDVRLGRHTIRAHTNRSVPSTDGDSDYPYFFAKSSALSVSWLLGVGLVCVCLGYQAFRLTLKARTPKDEACCPPETRPWLGRVSTYFQCPADALERAYLQKKLRYLFAFSVVCLLLSFFVMDVWSADGFFLVRRISEAVFCLSLVLCLLVFSFGLLIACHLRLGALAADACLRVRACIEASHVRWAAGTSSNSTNAVRLATVKMAQGCDHLRQWLLNQFPENGSPQLPRSTNDTATNRTVQSVLSVGYYLLLMGVAIAVMIWYLCEVRKPSPQVYARFWFERCTDMASGISPMVPTFFLASGLSFWIWFQLRRCGFLTYYRVPHPFGCDKLPNDPVVQEWQQGSFVKNLRHAHDETMDVLEKPVRATWKSAAFLIIFALLGFGLNRIWREFTWPAEPMPFSWILVGEFVCLCVAIAFTLVHLQSLWRKIQAVHKELVHLPMVSAFDRLPSKVSQLFGRFWGTARPRLSHLTVPVHQAKLIAEQYSKLRPHQLHEVGIDDTLQGKVATLLGPDKTLKLAATFEKEQCNERQNPVGAFVSETERELQEASIIFSMVLSRVWSRVSVKNAYGDTPRVNNEQPNGKEVNEYYAFAVRSSSNDSADLSLLDNRVTFPRSSEEITRVAVATMGYVSRKRKRSKKQEEPLNNVLQWLRLVEDFVAMQTVTYVSQFIVQLRNMVGFLTISALLVLLTVTSYPFQPQGLLLVFAVSLALAVAAAIVVLQVQMDRDELISRINGTTPHHINLDLEFLKYAATYVLPVILVVVTQLPGVGEFLSGLLDPFSRVLSK
jgi:hypothetical protein